MPLGPDHLTIRAEKMENRASILHGEGKAEVKTSAFTLHADEIDFDPQLRTLTARGNVQIKLSLPKVQAMSVYIQGENLSSTGNPPERFRGPLKISTDLFALEGKDVDYRADTNEVTSPSSIQLKLLKPAANLDTHRPSPTSGE